MKITISALDGRVIAIASPSHHARWAWITGTIASEFGCDPDDVHEADDNEEIMVVCGAPVARVERFYGWRAL